MEMDTTGKLEETTVLRTENLVKRYGKRTVVNDVSFNVKQGEIVGLLGPNGAGKTTSFYMTTGLVIPNGGRIFLNDKEKRTLRSIFEAQKNNIIRYRNEWNELTDAYRREKQEYQVERPESDLFA